MHHAVEEHRLRVETGATIDLRVVAGVFADVVDEDGDGAERGVGAEPAPGGDRAAPARIGARPGQHDEPQLVRVDVVERGGDRFARNDLVEEPDGEVEAVDGGRQEEQVLTGLERLGEPVVG